MANKEDLRKRNRELRHKMAIKVQQDLLKKQARAAEELEQKRIKDNNPKVVYPELILTMSKRLKRIDPWNTVAGIDKYQSVLITHYKLKQFGIDELRIGANSLHAWNEFKYDDRWWIFDPVAVRVRKLGAAVKCKCDATEIEYVTLSKYFTDVDEYIDSYNEYLTLTKDECKIAAMEDEGLNSVLKIKYH